MSQVEQLVSQLQKHLSPANIHVYDAIYTVLVTISQDAVYSLLFDRDWEVAEFVDHTYPSNSRPKVKMDDPYIIMRLMQLMRHPSLRLLASTLTAKKMPNDPHCTNGSTADTCARMSELRAELAQTLFLSAPTEQYGDTWPFDFRDAHYRLDFTEDSVLLTMPSGRVYPFICHEPNVVSQIRFHVELLCDEPLVEVGYGFPPT